MTEVDVREQEVADSEDGHLEWLNLSEILDDPDNLREKYDGIEDLAASIKAHGLLQPIVVRRNREGQYIIVMGHRRKRALVLAGQQRTRVIVRHKEMLSEQVIAAMLIENGNRKDLNPMEEAFGVDRIKRILEDEREPGSKEVTDGDVARYIGRTQVWVSDRFRLLGLSPQHQQMIREGRMTLTEGKRLGGANSGRTRPGAVGKKSGGWFTTHHHLSEKAMRRCKALGHNPKGPNYVNIACGACWETVIRNDEREKARDHAHESGHCGVCGSQIEKEPVDEQHEDSEDSTEETGEGTPSD